jgi:hypothetical protein
MTIRQTLLVLASVATLVGTAADAALAQGRGMRFGSSVSRLLNMAEVQNELKLEGDALAKVKEFAEKSQAKMREEMQAIRDQGLSEADQRAEIIAVSEELLTKDMAELEGLFTPEQFKRFQQLIIQTQGPSAVARKEVAEAIGLPEEARAELRKKLEEMNAANMAKMQELFQSGDRDKAQALAAENRKAVEAAVMEVLDDDQKSKFAALKGAEFKFPEPQAPGGRRAGF